MEEEDDWTPLQTDNLLLDKVVVHFGDKQVKAQEKADDNNEAYYMTQLNAQIDDTINANDFDDDTD